MKSRWFAAAVLTASLAASAAAAHEFRVYFQFDSIAFVTGADPAWPFDVIKDLACYGKSPHVSRLTVYARSDAMGDATYNLDLSYRRGRRVADLLAREGVDRRKIVVVAYGEAVPAVAGPDGTPEPLNRMAVMDTALAENAAGPPPKCTGRTLPKRPDPPR